MMGSFSNNIIGFRALGLGVTAFSWHLSDVGSGLTVKGFRVQASWVGPLV